MKEDLKEFTEVLLNENASFLEIRNSCEALYDFFVNLSSFEIPIDNSFFPTKYGRALPPYVAALCIKDMIRTRQTIRGIYKAIKDKLNEQVKPVKILYAGSGPFATLVTPLTTCFSPAEVKFQLLEIHPDSVQLLNKIINDLDVSDYVYEVLTTDATSFRVSDNFIPDIIISETMNAALICEPQVAIMAHLVNQVPLSTIMIPEKIVVDVCLSTGQTIEGNKLLELGTLIEFDDTMARKIANQPELLPILNDGITISIPQTPEDYRDLILRTSITVYKDVKIGFNESGLTVPLLQMVRDQKTSSFPPALNFYYAMGKRPEFIYRKSAN